MDIDAEMLRVFHEALAPRIDEGERIRVRVQIGRPTGLRVGGAELVEGLHVATYDSVSCREEAEVRALAYLWLEGLVNEPTVALSEVIA